MKRVFLLIAQLEKNEQFNARDNLNWLTVKPPGSIACTRNNSSLVFWSCSSMVKKDATPLTPPSAWSEHFSKLNHIQSMITENQKNITIRFFLTLSCWFAFKQVIKIISTYLTWEQYKRYKYVRLLLKCFPKHFIRISTE